MAVYETVILDQNNLPVAGARGYIYVNGSLAALTDDLGQPLENPIITDANGRAKATVPYPTYIVRWYWGGIERLVEDIVPAVGAEVLADVTEKVSEAQSWSAAAQGYAAAAQSGTAAAQAGAEAAQAGARTAQSLAEAARDAAFVNAAVYADVATGLAAVADGAQFMVVSGDEIIRYRRDAGPVAVEVARYASASKLANLPFEVERGPDLLRYVDLMGQVFYRIDANGEVYIPGQRQSIQDRLDAAPERDGGTIKGTDIAAVEDAAGNVVMRLKEDGSLVLPRIGNVQNALGAPLPGATIPRHTARHYLHSSISPLLSDLALQRIDYAPPPALLVPNNMGIPDTFVSAFTTTAPAPTPLNTPYRDNDRTVHPYLIEMPRPFCGYRYLMAQTPYSLTAHENPCIFGSNDLVNFTLLGDMPQPLSSQEVGPYNYHSDNSFTYDPVNGELICAYRRSDDTTDKLLLRRTRDGQTWTPEEVYYVAPSGDGMLSPSLLYDPNTKLWNMWACRNQGWLTRYTAPDILGPWTKVSDQTTSTNFGFTAWHLEVKFMGSKVVALVNQKETGANLFFGVSSDFDTWTFGKALINPAQSGTYKGTFLPEFDGNNLTMVIAWNTNVTDTAANDKQFFITRTNTVNLNTL